MKILICTGIYPPAIGGPAYYALGLENEFRRQGHTVRVLTYGFERKLPPIVRHIYFFLRTCFSLFGVDFVIALDTFSVGWPSMMASRLFGKKNILRIGGDFLWESYVERTHEDVTLSDFYKTFYKKLNLKEKLIFLITRFTLENSSVCVFSTSWQKDIWTKAYGLNPEKNVVIENEYKISNEKTLDSNFKNEQNLKKIYLWAGRDITLKNIVRLKKAFTEAQKKDSSLELSLVSGVSKEELYSRIAQCYAFILPSLSDVSPNVVLEAIGFGKPCIVTKENGIKDRLNDTVLYIDPLDQKDIEQKILNMAEPEIYKIYADRAQTFSFVHTTEDIAREFLALYSRIQ